MFPLLMFNVSGNKTVDLKRVWVICGLTETKPPIILLCFWGNSNLHFESAPGPSFFAKEETTYTRLAKAPH